MNLKNSAPVQALTGRKLVESPVLNRLGLQVARTYGARWFYNLRPTPATADVADALSTLRRDGMVTIENFLDPSLFEQLRDECKALLDHDSDRLTRKEHGPTQYSIAVIDDYPDFDTPLVDQFFQNERLTGIMSAAEKRKLDLSAAHRAVEWVKQGENPDAGDPETVLHSDIFFHTHKAWLYLSDVTPASAPLVFVKGSHRLNRVQARNIYRHSCNPQTPSRRIEESELERLGLTETVLRCPANTLVVANVCGYHRRSVGEPGGERLSLHCSVRSQPFVLWKNK